MPRRGQIAKRDVLPDPLYNSKLVTRLINSVMYDGKKGVAQKIVYDAFNIIAEKTGKEPLEVFDAAMENVMPVLEVKARRVGGATYQVPIEVRPERRQTLGLRWITLYARQRSERTMKERLANEIMDAVNETGSAFKSAKTLTRWQKQTKLLLISGGKLTNIYVTVFIRLWRMLCQERSLLKNKKYWYNGAYRRR